MDLSLGKLQQLVAVARAGSFSKAALELNISQPALSRSIAAIEERYGFTIFHRLGHGVQLTAAGAQVIELAQPLLQRLQVFDNNLRMFGTGKGGLLSVGLAPLLASQALAPFASEFFGASSQAQLQVLIRPGAILVEALRNATIELFFFPEGYIEPDPEVDVESVGTILPVCVVRRGHPLAARSNLTLADLADFPWASSVVPSVIEEALHPVQFVCDNYHILRDVVLGSDLVCICSALFVAEQLADRSLQEIRVEGLPLPLTTIYTAKLHGRVRSPLAEEAVRRMRQQLSER